MVIDVQRQNRETTQALIRRFTKRVKESGVLFRARKNRFKKRPKSKQMKKKAALRREQLRKEYAKMAKLGKPLK